MPKGRCCVPGCMSGTLKDVKYTQAAGLRGKSFFSFPKNEDLRNKWKEAICLSKEEIVDKYKICELHFGEKDIKKFDEIILKGGKVHVMERQRYILFQGAIPRVAINHDDIVKERIQKYYDKLNDKAVFINDYKVQFLYNDKDNKMKIIANTETEAEKINLFKNQISKANLQKKITSIELPETGYLRDSNFKEICNQSENMRLKIISATSTVSSDNNITVETKNNTNSNYTFCQLIHDLETRNLQISSSWSYSVQKIKEVVIFTYVHPVKLKIHVFCTIDHNMNVKISTFDRKINIYNDVKFNSKADFALYLFKLQRTICCDGTGIKNIYSKRCQGFINSTKCKQISHQRCISCKQVRKVISKNENNSLRFRLVIKVLRTHHA